MGWQWGAVDLTLANPADETAFARTFEVPARETVFEDSGCPPLSSEGFLLEAEGYGTVGVGLAGFW